MTFLPGQSGNPGGRPKWEGAVKEAIELAKENTPKAISRLVALMDDPDPRIQCVAANSILDRAIGKPQQAVQLSGEVATYVARLPQVVETTALWMEQHQPQSLSGSQIPALKPPT